MRGSLGYPRSARLRLPGEFRRVLATGDAWPGREAIVRRAPNDVGNARLGISTPRRYGSSVARNRFRRLAREAFRRMREGLGPYDYVVSPRKGLEVPTLAGLQADLRSTTERPPAPPAPRPAGRRGP
jgi:ribonuclease P protein component